MAPFVVIASLASLAFIVFAVVARVPTYRVAPAFLIPIVWGVLLLRRRLHLHPVHFALFAIALLLHNLGALGFYQRSVLGVSFDVYVHFYFGVVAGLLAHRYLAHELPLSGWPLRVAAVLCVMGFGAIHEIAEFMSYLILGEEKGMLKKSSYAFDTSRDLTMNLLGCALALLVIAIVEFREPPRRDGAKGGKGAREEDRVAV